MFTVNLSLLEGFDLRCDGRPVLLPVTAQRVVAFLALHDHDLQRPYVAGSLWREATEERASANLRSALWRIHRSGLHLVQAGRNYLGLAPDVRVDVRELLSQARALLGGDPDVTVDERFLAMDLLPDWYDEWLIVEREPLRQLRLHALEALTERLIAEGKYGHAANAALAAVRAEPLRETPHRLLVTLHLLEGNRVEALREYRAYKESLWNELRIEPSPRMEEAVVELTVARR